jgi:hypothetical protein
VPDESVKEFKENKEFEEFKEFKEFKERSQNPGVRRTCGRAMGVLRGAACFHVYKS